MFKLMKFVYFPGAESIETNLLSSLDKSCVNYIEVDQSESILISLAALSIFPNL